MDNQAHQGGKTVGIAVLNRLSDLQQGEGQIFVLNNAANSRNVGY
jgi:hypothetical protein